MRRTVTTVIALLAAAAMLLTLASCGETAEKTEASMMQTILDDLTENTEYKNWKSVYSEGNTIEEKLNGDSIVISTKGSADLDDNYVFSFDGTYIVNTSDVSDYTGYSILMWLKDGVADYYGMNSTLMSGYLAGLSTDQTENKYFVTESTDKTHTFKLYAACAWEMEGLDKMYVNDAAVDGFDVLGEDSMSRYVNAGKITTAAIGNAAELDLIVGEYGDENTDLTYKSIETLVNRLQPNGYKTFLKEYSPDTHEASGDGYTVTSGIPVAVTKRTEYKAADGYTYLTVVFGYDDTPAADAESAEKPAQRFAGSYQADRCSLTVTAQGTSGAMITAAWGNSADSTTKWEIFAIYEPETQCLRYVDGTKKTLTYNEKGDVIAEKVEYKDGAGLFRLDADHALHWDNEKEPDTFANMTFEYLEPTD